MYICRITLLKLTAQSTDTHQHRSEDGVQATLEELARTKGVTPSYVSRVLRLTLLAPEIVEAILDGRQPRCSWMICWKGFRWSGLGSATAAGRQISCLPASRRARH
jgi:hypothetical protein